MEKSYRIIKDNEVDNEVDNKRKNCLGIILQFIKEKKIKIFEKK